MVGFYITGTDTGIGKTVASVALLHALRAGGLRAIGMKPVASGCEVIDGAWQNDDARQLQDASEPRPPYADVNPYALPLPLAPELAARDAGIDIALAPILAAHARLAVQCDAMVVEGVGGWMAPLSARIDQVEVVHALQLSVVLVVGVRLGCINAARLTARALEADGVAVCGWIGNVVDPAMDRCTDNLAILRARMPMPCLGTLEWDPGADAHSRAACLSLSVPPLACT